MGETLQTITCETWCAQNGVSPDALRMAFPKIGLSGFAKNRTLSVSDIAKISAYPFRNREASVSASAPIPVSLPAKSAEKPAPKKAAAAKISAAEIRGAALSALLICVVVGHTALVWYDCAVLWHTPGMIGGGVVFMVVLAALLLAADNTRTRTSSTALWFVFFIDVAAWFVHFDVFKAQNPGNDTATGVLCGFLCACSFAALYFYQDMKID